MPLKRSKVSPNALRALFKQSGIEAKVTSGEYLFVFDYDRVPTILPGREPPGTRSQIAHVYDVPNRVKVAILHRYLRPDGTIGASGRWDPKLLRIGDVIYSL